MLAGGLRRRHRTPGRPGLPLQAGHLLPVRAPAHDGLGARRAGARHADGDPGPRRRGERPAARGGALALVGRLGRPGPVRRDRARQPTRLLTRQRTGGH
ncbi:Exonuclease SbcC [Nocardioides sp. AX2bis]|nr:Exonuclease SbcC [Nocardioides sp. AX2bis]